jgi:hypothetical protein
VGAHGLRPVVPQTVDVASSDWLVDDQPGFFQQSQVPRDGWLADPELPGKLDDRALSLAQLLNDSATIPVLEGLKGGGGKVAGHG